MHPDRIAELAQNDPHAPMERTLISEYLQMRGHTLASLRDLPPATAEALLKDASLYASGRLTEIESRARYVKELHGARPLRSARK